MVPLDKSLSRLVREGLIEMTNALIYAQDSKNFRSLLR